MKLGGDINNTDKLLECLMKAGYTGDIGPQGKGFIIFDYVNTFNDLSTLNPTNNNIGEFVLVK
jgi:hypothetical protein